MVAKLFSLNLWNPSDTGLISILTLSYLLGVIHGITPDEHTWPITFSYSVSSGGSRAGAKAGMIFSAGFTIQRAILSEVAYFALAGIFMTALSFGFTYVAVGLAMAAAGVYFARKKHYFHIHILEKLMERLIGLHGEHSLEQDSELGHTTNPVESRDGAFAAEPIPSKLALVHGLIAGFGFGAFALILYTVFSPSMPSPWLGFVPGLLFGLGTMTMQLLFGAFFAGALRRVGKLTKEGIDYVSGSITANVLLYGGVAFVLSGILVIAMPGILNLGLNTGISVHNLNNLGIGFFLVVFSVGIVGIATFVSSIRKARRLGYVGNIGGSAAKEQVKV